MLIKKTLEFYDKFNMNQCEFHMTFQKLMKLNTVNIIFLLDEQQNQDTDNFLQILESKIDADTLNRFKTSGKNWNGDVEFKKLFELWYKCASQDDNQHMIDNDESAVHAMNVVSPNLENGGEIVYEVVDATFELIDNYIEEPTSSVELNATQNHSRTTQLDEIPRDSSNIITNDIDSSSPTTSSTPSSVSFTESHRVITPRPVLEPLENIIFWPKQPITKSKRKTEHLPSVLTSKKWQEIQTAKKQEKEAIEEEKRIKKEEIAKKKQQALMEKEERKRIKELETTKKKERLLAEKENRQNLRKEREVERKKNKHKKRNLEETLEFENETDSDVSDEFYVNLRNENLNLIQ